MHFSIVTIAIGFVTAVVNGYTCPSPCDGMDGSTPCDCELDATCDICQENQGCSRCINGYFQKDVYHPCINCIETFGEGCLHCADQQGCQQCDQENGYIRAYDSSCQLWYCKSPIDECNPTYSNIRLLFEQAYFEEDNSMWCYDYQLWIDSSVSDSDSSNPCLVSENEFLNTQWSINFDLYNNDSNNSCDDSDQLTNYLVSVKSKQSGYEYEYNVDYTISENIFYFDTSVSNSNNENGNIYSLCFSNELANDVSITNSENNEYCLMNNNNAENELCVENDISIPDICGVEYNRVFKNSGYNGDYPIDYVPMPGESYSLTDDSTVDGEGTFTLKSNIFVIRGYWIESCTMDGDSLTILIKSGYSDTVNQALNDLETSLLVNDSDPEISILMPIYDRWLVPYGCGTIQGNIIDYDTNIQGSIFNVLTQTEIYINLDVNIVEYFTDADFEINEFVQMNSPEMSSYGNNHTTVKCALKDTNETIIIENTYNDDIMNYIDEILVPYAKENNRTLICYGETDLEFEDIVGLNNGDNVTYVNDTNSTVSYENYNDVTVEQLDDWDDNWGNSFTEIEYDLNDYYLNDTRLIPTTTTATRPTPTGNRRRLLFSMGSDDLVHTNLATYKEKTISTNNFKCHFIAYFSAEIKVGFKLKIKWFSLHHLYGIVTLEFGGGLTVDCSIYADLVNYQIWKKTFRHSSKMLLAVGPVILTYAPFITTKIVGSMEADFKARHSVSFNSKWVAKAGFDIDQGGIFSSLDPENSFKRDWKYGSTKGNCIFSFDGSLAFVVEPGIMFGIFGINGLAFSIPTKLPRLDFAIDYPASNSQLYNKLAECRDDCTVSGEAILAVDIELKIQIGLRFFVPELRIRLFGKRFKLWGEKTLVDKIIREFILWSYEKCGTYEYITEAIGEGCCVDEAVLNVSDLCIDHIEIEQGGASNTIYDFNGNYYLTNNLQNDKPLFHVLNSMRSKKFGYYPNDFDCNTGVTTAANSNVGYGWALYDSNDCEIKFLDNLFYRPLSSLSNYASDYQGKCDESQYSGVYYHFTFFRRRRPYWIVCYKPCLYCNMDINNMSTTTTTVSPTSSPITINHPSVQPSVAPTQPTESPVPNPTAQGSCVCYYHGTGLYRCTLDVLHDSTVYPSTQGSDTSLIVGLHPNYPLKRSLIQFDNVNSCYAGGCTANTLESAKLYLYYDRSHKASSQTADEAPLYPHNLKLYQVLREWNEYSVTSTSTGISGASWNSAYVGTDDIDAKSTEAGIPDSVEWRHAFNHRWIEFDVTYAVQNWLNGEPNYGLLLKVEDESIETRDIRFFSRENSDDNGCTDGDFTPTLYL